MLRVTQKDYNFFLLCSYLKSPPPDNTRLVKAIQTFRSKLSLKWLDLILDDEDPVECLKYVWLVLFKLSTHDDSTIRVTTYNTIGGLLFTLLPFSPHHIIHSFSQATQEYKMTTRASICIVSSFLYICHFISPSDLEDFITNTPVMPHFGVDVSGFIQYIPKFVRLMRPLNVQFHKVLLRSLLSSFGRKPNHDFVKSVVLLVGLNPEVLIKDLMEFIISNSLDQTILAIGPQILLSDEIFVMLSENYINHFMVAALNAIASTESILSEFEQACGTLSILVARYEGEKLASLKQKIREALIDDSGNLKEYPKHFHRLLLQLPTPLEDLQIKPGDANSIKCAKIGALLNYAQKVEDKGPVLSMLNSLNQTCPDGDVLTSLINVLKPLFPLLLKRENLNSIDGLDKFREDNKTLANLVRSILLRKNLTWLQNVSILNLLLAIGIDVGDKLIDDFEEIIIPLILEFACSPQIELSSVATSTLSAFVNLNNIAVIKKFLWSVNYFEPQSALPFVTILNIVADAIGTFELVEFSTLAGELIIFFPNEPEIAGKAFNFINKCEYYQNVSNVVISSCIDWITRLYSSITQNSSKVSSPLKNDPLTPLISTVETDVVASDLLDIRSKLLPLLFCYNFFISLKGILSPYCLLFTKELTRIFPDEIIPILLKVPPVNVKNEFPEMPGIICSILKCAPSLETASVCCDFLVNFAPIDTLSSQKELIEFFIKNPKVVDGKLLYHFYQFLIKVSPNRSDQLLDVIKKKLDPINLAIFEMKIGSFTVEKFGEFKSKVDFSEWPPSILHFFKHQTKLNSEKQNENCEFSIELSASQLESLDFIHFAFYFHNKDRFVIDPEVYKNYAYQHKHYLMKLEVNHVEEHFVFQAILEVTSKDQSILPGVVSSIKTSEKFSVTSEALIQSFFQSTQYLVTQKVIDDILEQIKSPKTALIILSYIKKHKLEINDDQLLSLVKNSHDEFLMKEVSKLISKERSSEFFDLVKSDISGQSCLSFPASLKLFTDPDHYLSDLRTELFFNGEEVELKWRKLRTFCEILSQSPNFSADDLFSLLSTVILPSIPTYSSSKKKILFILRIIHESLYLRKREVPPQFIKELTEQITELESSEISYIFTEFSRIFVVLFEISDQPELFGFVESFDKVVKQTALFIVSQSVALSRNSEGVVSNRINKGSLNDQLNDTTIPSQRYRVIQALDKLLNNRNFWTLIVQVLPNVVKTYSEFSNSPLFDTLLAKFTTTLSADINFESIRSVFTQKILPFFFVQPNTPSFSVFAEAASVAIQQIAPPLPAYLQFIDKVMSTKPLEPKAGHFYRQFVQWLMKFEQDPIRRSDIILEELSIMQKIYLENPSLENSDGLIEAIHQPSEGVDVILMLFGKIALMCMSKLQVVVLINKYVRNASDEEKQNCKDIFQSLIDSYEPKIAEAIKLVLDGKPLLAALC